MIEWLPRLSKSLGFLGNACRAACFSSSSRICAKASVFMFRCHTSFWDYAISHLACVLVDGSPSTTFQMVSFSFWHTFPADALCTCGFACSFAHIRMSTMMIRSYYSSTIIVLQYSYMYNGHVHAPMPKCKK